MFADHLTFLLWATRAMHLFAAMLWVGGLLYQSAVTIPLSHGETSRTRGQLLRFIPFAWMSAWTLLVTGVALSLFSTRYVFLSVHDGWSVVVLLKQLAFVCMAVLLFGQSRMLKRSSTDKERETVFFDRALVFHRVSVLLAILVIVLASSLYFL